MTTDDIGTILTQISEQLQNLDLRLLELERGRTEANVLLFNGITVAAQAVDAERGERTEADAALEARISSESDEKFNAYLDACSRLMTLEKAAGFFDNEPAAPAWPPRPVSVVFVPIVPGDDSRPDTYEDGTPV
jgi:hypothetical protein